MNITDVRAALAVAFASTDDTDPEVYADLVDAIDVPCLMLLWNEPPTEEIGPCNVLAKPLVIAVAGRIEPGETLGVLEQLWMWIARRLRDDANAWGVVSFGSPRIMDIGGISYLASRVELRVAATLVPNI